MKFFSLAHKIFILLAATIGLFVIFLALQVAAQEPLPVALKVSRAPENIIAPPSFASSTRLIGPLPSRDYFKSTSPILEKINRKFPFYRIPILMYHYIEKPRPQTNLPGLYLPPNIFAEQLQAISQAQYQTIFMSDLALGLNNSERLASPAVILSFDDGYEDFYTQAWPLLKKYKIKSTIYIIINALDKPGYLTKSQLKELAASGLVEIGSHTFNHPDLRHLKFKDLRFEIEASRPVLERLSGQAVLTFAYPYGYYNQEMVPLLAAAGYLSAVSVKPGDEQGRDNIWLLQRLRPGNRRGPEFAAWLKARF